MTISQLLHKLSRQTDPLDLELILSATLQKSREFVMIHPEYALSKIQESKATDWAKRRSKGEPLAYILGHREFFGLDFKVNPSVLIPRPETELMVEMALEELRNCSRKRSCPRIVADIGTGSGNIIISVASNLQHKMISGLKFFGTDISKKALAVAKQNAKRHKMTKKITFLSGDLLKPIFKKTTPRLKNPACLFLANLPYVTSGQKKLLRNQTTRGLKFEPAGALYAGKDGLDDYRRLAKQLTYSKIKNVILLCEIDPLQTPGIKKLFHFAKSIAFHRDLAGRNRIAKITL